MKISLLISFLLHLIIFYGLFYISRSNSFHTQDVEISVSSNLISDFSRPLIPSNRSQIIKQTPLKEQAPWQPETENKSPNLMGSQSLNSSNMNQENKENIFLSPDPSLNQTTNSSPEMTNKAEKDYLSQIRFIIENKKIYPLIAQKRHWEGVVKVQFELNREGQVISFRLLEKSQYEVLNEAAHKLIQELTFQPFPNTLTSTTLSIILPIHYRLK